MTNDLTNLARHEDYRRWLSELKQRVERARQRAAASANRELIKLYWQIESQLSNWRHVTGKASGGLVEAGL